ncbi:MAG: hypothetical protein CM1200mP39_18040 [Dehalococcoidia bacterium]|nr:MAG: hypothetical protein CM1200mP39_18040 [Dehalococcoidia bacterium]
MDGTHSIGETNKSTGLSILEKLGVTPLINAGGPNTKHSGSRPRAESTTR